jgi:hypothetical protein
MRYVFIISFKDTPKLAFVITQYIEAYNKCHRGRKEICGKKYLMYIQKGFGLEIYFALLSVYG